MEADDIGGNPGEIVRAEMDDLRVACGRGTILKIEELQPEGKRRMAVRDFVNGFKPAVGEVFGSRR